MDLAVIGLEARSDGIVKATGDLYKLTASAKKADAAADQLSGATAKADAATDGLSASAKAATASLNQEAAAFKVNASAANVAAMAQRDLAKAQSMASFQRKNLIFQLNDVGVSLASGMNPMMVAIQQGSQISQIYAGSGGVSAALRETASMAGMVATRFGGLAGAAGLVLAGLGGISERVRILTGEASTMGESFRAALQVSGISTSWEYTTSKIGDGFDWIAGKALDVAEMIINAFVAAGIDIAFVWDQFPNVVGAAFTGAANLAIGGLNKMTEMTVSAVNTIIEQFNKIPGVAIDMLAPTAGQMETLPNLFKEDIDQAIALRNRLVNEAMAASPIRSFMDDAANQVATNRAIESLKSLSSIDFGPATQSANAYSGAVGNIGKSAGSSVQQVINLQQNLVAANLSNVTSKTAFEGLELIRGSLKQLGGDAASVDRFVDSIVNGSLKVRQLESNVKSLSLSIASIPDKTINITTVTRSFDVGGGKTVNVTKPTGAINTGASSGNYGDNFYTLAEQMQQSSAALDAISTIDMGSMGPSPNLIGSSYFAKGGIANKPSIFGEAGPEAAVPLPDGRSIPVTMSGGSWSAIEEYTAKTSDGIERLIGITQTWSTDVMVLLRQMQAARSVANSNTPSTGATSGPWSGHASGALSRAFGFASGGMIPASGPGSSDSQYIRFMKRPDEDVVIHTPQQREAMIAAYSKQYADGLKDGATSQTINFGDIKISTTGPVDERSARAAADAFTQRVRASMSNLNG